ncbi:unnamed protein product [Auanema sp. JU1783]|nr:unnamed protein product [Auanema sp. JU1783]
MTIRGFPLVGLGTWQSSPGVVGSAVESALLNGYKHIDCAWIYGNQKEIGAVFEKLFAGSIKREDIFITSKIWNTFHSYDSAAGQVDTILEELKLDYIDLLLIHWPMGYQEGGEVFPRVEGGDQVIASDVDYLDTWRALEDAKAAGKVRNIGISNFNHKQILRVIENSKEKPQVLQVEIHPYLQQKKLRQFCKEHGIEVTAYSSLGNPGSALFRKEGDPNILVDPVVEKIAKAHNKSTAQVALRWAVQQGIHVIPKSVTPERIIQNSQLFDFTLTADEMAEMDSLDRNFRLVDLSVSSSTHEHYFLKEEF